MLNAVALVLVLTGLGMTFGFLLALADKKLSVPFNPLIEEVEEELPKGQCGSCGFAGCRQYAEAVVDREDVPPNLCTPGGNDVAKIVAKLTGKAAEEMTPMKAVLQCSGTRDLNCSIKHLYDGLEDCNAAAMLYAGDKVCEFGCLGQGNCARACPYGAISMNNYKLPDIDPGKCVGCGICVETCPRGVLALIPEYAKSVIRCQNTDKGAVTRKACEVGCIGCKMCERTCPNDAIQITNGLAVITYDKCKSCDEPVCLVVKCKPGALKPYYGVEIPDIEPPKPKPLKKPVPKAAAEAKPEPEAKQEAEV